MRRTIAAAFTSTAVLAGLVAAAPAATAADCRVNGSYQTQPCADPKPVSVTASPSATTIKKSGSKTISLNAVFDDPADIMNGVDFTIALPDGTTRTAYANGYHSKSGVRETYRATYTAYTFYAPGTYAVRAVARRDFNRATAFSGTPTATGSFTVKHKAFSNISSSKFVFRKGEKLRFNGKVRNTTRPGKLKVRLQFKANGKGKKWKNRSKVVRTNQAGEWRSKKVRMNKAGKWRAKIGGKGNVVGSKTPALTVKFRR